MRLNPDASPEQQAAATRWYNEKFNITPAGSRPAQQAPLFTQLQAPRPTSQQAPRPTSPQDPFQAQQERLSNALQNPMSPQRQAQLQSLLQASPAQQMGGMGGKGGAGPRPMPQQMTPPMGGMGGKGGAGPRPMPQQMGNESYGYMNPATPPTVAYSNYGTPSPQISMYTGPQMTGRGGKGGAGPRPMPQQMGGMGGKGRMY